MTRWRVACNREELSSLYYANQCLFQVYLVVIDYSYSYFHVQPSAVLSGPYGGLFLAPPCGE
jgi:hypothetical protein